MRFFNQILTFSQGAQSTAGTNLFLEKVLMKTRLNLLKWSLRLLIMKKSLQTLKLSLIQQIWVKSRNRKNLDQSNSEVAWDGMMLRGKEDCHNEGWQTWRRVHNLRTDDGQDPLRALSRTGVVTAAQSDLYSWEEISKSEKARNEDEEHESKSLASITQNLEVETGADADGN